MIVNSFFYFFSCVLLISSLMIILSQNSIYSVLFLVLSFVSSSSIIFLLECEYISLIFIIIYVGAIAVLFLFVVMMLDIKTIYLAKDSLKYFPFGSFLGVVFKKASKRVRTSDLVSMNHMLYQLSYTSLTWLWPVIL